MRNCRCPVKTPQYGFELPQPFVPYATVRWVIFNREAKVNDLATVGPLWIGSWKGKNSSNNPRPIVIVRDASKFLTVQIVRPCESLPDTPTGPNDTTVDNRFVPHGCPPKSNWTLQDSPRKCDLGPFEKKLSDNQPVRASVRFFNTNRG